MVRNLFFFPPDFESLVVNNMLLFLFIYSILLVIHVFPQLVVAMLTWESFVYYIILVPIKKSKPLMSLCPPDKAVDKHHIM